MFRPPVFREAALERLSSPEGLDQAIQVTHPRAWLALLAAGILLAFAIFWGLFGSIATKVQGQGLFARTGGVHPIVAVDAGQVNDLWVRRGSVVEAGEAIASLYRPQLSAAEQTRYVVSPCAGRVVEIRVEAGQVVDEDTVLASVEPLNSPLEAVVYVPPTDGKRVQPGMEAQLAPGTVKPEEHGYLLGKVRSVSPFPASQQAMAQAVGAAELARQFSAQGPPYELHVQLERDPTSPNGFRWSSRGPEIQVASGTLCAARIVVERQRPLSLLFPVLKKKLGLYTGPTFDDPASPEGR